ncbi:MAG: CoA-binding protein [Thermoprotei archaeon]|nr:MAG: CoA-binding protein [Thermoprotei archaeon]
MSSENLNYFFNPRTIAVIGASRESDKPGHVIFSILLDNKKKGLLKANVYPVNPKAKEILGVKAYPSVKEIEDDVELAIIVVPARIVPKVIKECGEKGVKASIIISAGFSEVGNKELEEEVLKTAKAFNIRIIGPNCIGILSPWSGVDTIFLPVYKRLNDGKLLISTPRPKPGHIALLSQSGAFGTAAIDYMVGEGIGLSIFVSYGNKADVDEADLLEYLIEHERTRVILMYLESIERGRKFIEVARKTSVIKPIIALKAGRTTGGSRAAASHTAALAGLDEVYDAAFRRAGIIRTYDIEELFDVAKALVMLPPTSGGRIGIITDGGGAGVMATDMAELLGLEVPELRGSTREELERLKSNGIIPPFSSVANPIDLTGSATSEMYIETLDVLLRSNEVDIILVLALHQVPGIRDPIDLARKIGKKVKEYNFAKPVLAVDTGYSEAAVLERETFDREGIPSYPIPERAVRAARALYAYGRYLTKRKKFDDYMKKWNPLD